LPTSDGRASSSATISHALHQGPLPPVAGTVTLLDQKGEWQGAQQLPATTAYGEGEKVLRYVPGRRPGAMPRVLAIHPRAPALSRASSSLYPEKLGEFYGGPVETIWKERFEPLS